MSLISANPGSSQKELADWAGIAGPALVGVVDELEKRELVKRERAPEDRRRNMLMLTTKGERTMDVMFKAVSEIEAPIREELGPEDMRQLIDLIDRAVSALKKNAD
jgi:DNA-binding MarR family transcriptional regulator